MSDQNEPSDEQMYSALSFCVMLLLVGVPLWWKTTEVYRVPLPYSDIDSLHALDLHIKMNLHVVTINGVKGKSLINELQRFFWLSELYNITFKQHPIDKVLLGSLKSLEDIERKIKHPHFEGSLQLFEVPGLSRFTPDNIIPGPNRTIYFSSDTGAIQLYHYLREKILNEESPIGKISDMDSPQWGTTKQNLKPQIPLSKHIDVLFTVLNPDPESIDVDFSIPDAIEEHIAPFADELKDAYQFHIKSQWLYFVGLQVQPKFLNDTYKGSHFALSQDLLPHVITPLEKKLASHVSQYHSLNFVLYIPSCSSSPLFLYTKRGYQVEGTNAFISPKWGGIQIYNPGREACIDDEGKSRIAVSKSKTMAAFLEQFRKLLGFADVEVIGGRRKNHLTLWEKDALLRRKTVEHLTSAKLTLQSLSKLLGKINNIVINDHVGNSIYFALNGIREASSALAEGNLVEGHICSEKAYQASEKAFTDPSLLALLYFPDDQKYAVYIPLFLPVMIPVIISFKHIALWTAVKYDKRKNKKAKPE